MMLCLLYIVTLYKLSNDTNIINGYVCDCDDSNTTYSSIKQHISLYIGGASHHIYDHCMKV